MKKKKSCGALKMILRILGFCTGIYGILFIIFFFDLDGKLLFRVVEPTLVKHYDNMERKNPLDQIYDINKPDYEYDVD